MKFGVATTMMMSVKRLAVDDEIDVEVSITGVEAQVLSPRLLQTHRVTRREA